MNLEELASRLKGIEDTTNAIREAVGRLEAARLGRLLSLKRLEERLGVSRWTIRRWVRGRGFPEPLMLAGEKRWREEAVARWVEEVSEEARSGPVDHPKAA